VTQQFFVPGPLPGLNEILNAAKGRKGRFAYGRMKSGWDAAIVAHIRAARVQPIDCARLRFEWREGLKRDRDNIAVGKKFICDALVKAGVLPNDSAAHVVGFSDDFSLDRKRPGVLVTLESVLPSAA